MTVGFISIWFDNLILQRRGRERERKYAYEEKMRKKADAITLKINIKNKYFLFHLRN